MLAAEALFDRFRTARLVMRGLTLLKELGPYAAIEILLPGGSLIAIGLWLYSRHKAGKPLLPFTVRRRPAATQEPLFSRRAIEGFFILARSLQLPTHYEVCVDIPTRSPTAHIIEHPGTRPGNPISRRRARCRAGLRR
jgi:hypothetical protein